VAPASEADPHGERAPRVTRCPGGDGERRGALLHAGRKGFLRGICREAARIDDCSGFGGKLRHSPGGERRPCGKRISMALRAFDERKQAASATNRRHERLHRIAEPAVDIGGAWSRVGTLLFSPERTQPVRGFYCRGAGLSPCGRRRKRTSAARCYRSGKPGRRESETIVHAVVDASACATCADRRKLDSLGSADC